MSTDQVWDKTTRVYVSRKASRITSAHDAEHYESCIFDGKVQRAQAVFEDVEQSFVVSTSSYASGSKVGFVANM